MFNDAMTDRRLSAYRALASGSRVEILHLLQGTDEPLVIADIAAAVGLHPNTAREHLDRLIEAGFVVSEPEVRSSRGRPRLRYRAVERAAAATLDVRARAQLVKLLVSGYGKAMRSPAESARQAGERWALALVAAGAEPATDLSETEAGRAQLVALETHFEDLGFDPEVDEDQALVHLRRCPFVDLARERTEVVCSVHLGLAQGVLANVPGPLRATALEPFVGPRHCLLHLAVGPGAAPREPLLSEV